MEDVEEEPRETPSSEKHWLTGNSRARWITTSSAPDSRIKLREMQRSSNTG